MTQAIQTDSFFDNLYSAPEYKMASPNSYMSAGTGIYEDKANRTIFFPAAGYTKIATWTDGNLPNDHNLDITIMSYKGLARQIILGTLLNKMFPESENHSEEPRVTSKLVNIRLIPEPNNKYDKNAILIVVCIDNTHIPIGYVPAKITRFLHQKIEWLTPRSGVVIHKDHESKTPYLIPHISMMYSIPSNEPNRFANIQYD